MYMTGFFWAAKKGKRGVAGKDQTELLFLYDSERDSENCDLVS